MARKEFVENIMAMFDGGDVEELSFRLGDDLPSRVKAIRTPRTVANRVELDEYLDELAKRRLTGNISMSSVGDGKVLVEVEEFLEVQPAKTKRKRRLVKLK